MALKSAQLTEVFGLEPVSLVIRRIDKDCLDAECRGVELESELESSRSLGFGPESESKSRL